MSSASTSSRPARLDLASLAAALRDAWAGLQRWPLVAALSPALPVRLLRADGSETACLVDGAGARPERGDPQSAPFVALELPEDSVLLRTLALPALGEAELQQALALDVAAASPFAASDLVWGFATRPLRPGMLEAQLVIASRRQVALFLERSAPRLPTGQVAEVWVWQAPFGPVVLPGYGEDRRAARARRGRGLVLGLLLLAVVLAAAMAVTPTAQLRLRAVQAVQAMDSLVKRTEPAVKQRAALSQTIDSATALTDMLAQRSQPLQVLNLLTQALPDDTSLLGVTMEGRKVSINGLTGDAAALMQQLNGRPEFRDVKAPSPATRPLGSNKELFTIELTMAPPAGARPATAGGPVGAASAAGVPAPGPASPGVAGAPGQPPAAATAGAPPPPAPPAPPQPGGASFGGGATFGGAPVKKP